MYASWSEIVIPPFCHGEASSSDFRSVVAALGSGSMADSPAPSRASRCAHRVPVEVRLAGRQLGFTGFGLAAVEN